MKGRPRVSSDVRWARALVVALLIHAPLVPASVPPWLLRALRARPSTVLPRADQLVVPLDLSLAPERGGAGPAREQKPAEDPTEDQTRVEPAPPAALPVVAEPAPSSGLPIPQPSPDPRDPISHAGGLGHASALETHVKVFVATDLVRAHKLGRRVGDVLVQIPQWQELLAGTEIDPVRDFDHILLTGPHFHSARAVVAVVEFNVEPNRMQDAIERAMARSSPPGQWAESTSERVGHFGPDGVVAFRAACRSVITGPVALASRLREIPCERFPSSGDVVVHLWVRTPWRPLARFGFELPKSVTDLELRVLQRGSAFDVQLSATDENSSAEGQTLKQFVEIADALRDNPMPLASDWFDRPRFIVDGPTVRGEVRLSSADADRLLTGLEMALLSRPKAADPW
jgi:hypothetical protein